MPKNNWGSNSKAVEAKAREADKKREAAEKKQKEAEDAYWKDDDKNVAKKLERKEEKQRKHEEEVRRREENRKLLQMETEQLKNAKPKPAVSIRPTRYQVEIAKDRAELEEKERLGLATGTKAVESSVRENKATLETKKNAESDDDLPPIEENMNKLLTLGAGDGSARNVDQALVLLDDGDVDSHPERRMKKAHQDFEASMMEKLKAEYPSLKRSQLKEMIWREWQRSPQNPLNKAAKASND